MKEKNEIDLKQMRPVIEQLIREQKIKFDFYNSSVPLELLQICYNKTEDIIELSFRDIQKYYVEELKELCKKNEKK